MQLFTSSLRVSNGELEAGAVFTARLIDELAHVVVSVGGDVTVILILGECFHRDGLIRVADDVTAIYRADVGFNGNPQTNAVILFAHAVA